MSETQTLYDKDKDRALRLFTYLKEFVRLRSKIIRDIKTYDEVLWLHEIPHENGWYSAHWEGQQERADDVWVEFKKPKVPECPKPPAICEGWYLRADLTNTSEIPVIQTTKYVPATEESDQDSPDTLKLEDFPEVEQEWNKYLENKWLPWMGAFEKVRPAQTIYSQLFRMYQLANKLGEAYELVLGIGFLTWQTPQKQNVRRHIISAQARLDFDANTGSLSVHPSSDGAKMIFENDMLEPSELPAHDELQAIEASMQNHSENPWDIPVVYGLIRRWIYSLNPDGSFTESMTPSMSSSINPKCDFAPAIILRKRTQRGWITAFDRVIAQLKLKKNLPNNIRNLINLKDNNSSSSQEGAGIPSAGSSEPDSNVYFPLPTNESQLDIIRKLNSSDGVRVQGPPGTGKSHTIANIICHFLALGQKVLVTAYAPRALKVLQDRLPKNLLALCVSVLGHDTESMENLRSSVNEISERFNLWNESGNERKISQLKTKLNQHKQDLAVINKRLKELKEEDTYNHHDIKDYEGTVQEIAKKIKDNEAQYGWINDRVESGSALPFTNTVFKKFLFLLRDFDENEKKQLLCERVKSSEIPDPDIYRELMLEEQNVKDELESYKDYSQDHQFKSLMEVEIEKRRSALSSVTELRKAIDEGTRRSFHWLEQAVNDMLSDHDQPLRRLHDITRSRLNGLSEKAQIVDDYQVKLPDMDNAQLQADAEDLMSHLKSGKTIHAWPFQPKVIKKTKYLWKESYIDGRLCDNIITLEKLLELLDVEKRMSQLWSDWASRVNKADGSYVSQEAILYGQLEALESVLAIDQPLQECKSALRALSIMSEPRWHVKDELNELEGLFKASLAFETEKDVQERIKTIDGILQHYLHINNSSSINSELFNALKPRDLKNWSTAYHRLKELEKRSKLLTERENLIDSLKEQLPELHSELTTDYEESVWDSRCRSFEEAWQWTLADTWLQDYEAKHDSEKLNASFVVLQKEINQTTANLAASMAWSHCFRSMTHEQRAALEAWQAAIRRIGSGKRKGSAQAQRDAERYMAQCQKTIPAWIMPLYRAVDTVPMEAELFDVVIVDEASQCGPEALIVNFLAKKVIIVGDDEQVAPENVGVQVDDVHKLRTLYLDDIPLADSLGRDSTLFDNAGLRLREKVFLYEHFRCMPEIIQFCNDLCYAPLKKTLVPLRQYGPDRLDPPVKLKYIESGYRDTSSSGQGLMKTNRPEAENVVETILSCTADPRYENKTMGVISLLGDQQAKLIEGMLMKSMSPSEYEKRKLLCGTPASFQGDERNVIFISMVDAPPSRLSALTKDTDKRRLNVCNSSAPFRKLTVQRKGSCIPDHSYAIV